MDSIRCLYVLPARDMSLFLAKTYYCNNAHATKLVYADSVDSAREIVYTWLEETTGWNKGWYYYHKPVREIFEIYIEEPLGLPQ